MREVVRPPEFEPDTYCRCADVPHMVPCPSYRPAWDPGLEEKMLDIIMGEVHDAFNPDCDCGSCAVCSLALNLSTLHPVLYAQYKVYAEVFY